jgi:hypothetical protein
MLMGCSAASLLLLALFRKTAKSMIIGCSAAALLLLALVRITAVPHAHWLFSGCSAPACPVKKNS